MKILSSTGFLCFGLLMVFVAGSKPASATLGEGADSVTRDRRALAAAKGTASDHINYRVQVMTTDATEVREYLTPSGTVFAVAWNGLAHPDLSTLLGSYHRDYADARRQQPRRRGQKSMRVQADRVVVETWGHMRNLQGRAYVPSLIPTGVDIHAIR